MSLHRKLSRSYAILIATVSLIMLIGSFLAVCLVALPNIRISMQSKLSELENRINEEFSYLERATDSAFLNLNEVDYSIISGEYGNELQRYNTINRSLYMMRLIYSDVQWAFLLDNDGHSYADNALVEQALESNFDSRYNTILDDEHGRTRIFGLQTVPALNKDTPILLVGKHIHYVFNIKSVGYLYVATDSSVLDALFREQLIFDGQEIYVCGRDGKILSATDVDALGQPFDAQIGHRGWLLRYKGKYWLCQSRYAENLDADIYIIIPAAQLLKENNMYILVLLFASVAGFALALFESSSITRSILAPLHRLSEAMNKVRSGNIRVRCSEDEDDREIQLLASSFNHMLERIEQLIESVKQKQQEKTRIELTLQQNKIQPHFLYNSLNTVSALCRMGQLEEASHASELVSQYYRAVLSGGRDIITLGEEMHNVELYLQIIRVSRSEPFRLNIVCPDDSVLLYPIPKLTLQPFVENTVKHGFRGTESDELSVTIHEEDCYLSIVIEDNGIGVEQEVLNEAMCEDCDEHFGITSVRRRMQLLCGEDYSMSAESRPGEGTRVILRYHASELSVGEEARPIAP